MNDANIYIHMTSDIVVLSIKQNDGRQRLKMCKYDNNVNESMSDGVIRR